MSNLLTDDVRRKIKESALTDSPNETCGLLFCDNNNQEIKAIRCENYARDRKHAASISPFDFLKVSVTGEILGYFHSHVNEYEDFSLTDKIQAEAHNLTSILYCVFNDSFKEYTPNGYKNPYIGRNFQIGKNDCFSLFRDFYKNELKIEVQDCIRNENWFKNNEDLFEDMFNKENFIKYDNIKEIQKNDGIIFNMIKDKPSHITIYLGNYNILHHPREQLSLIEVLTEPYIRRIAYFIRHKSLCNKI